MKTTVIYHSADYDGLFCREIARTFLPDAELIGWNFGDKPLPIPDGQIYVLDLPVDQPFGFKWGEGAAPDPKVWVGLVARIVWIDHHKSSIDSHPTAIPGYRIDGVAACRLAWQWFRRNDLCGDVAKEVELPVKQSFLNRTVLEPYAVQLAGEYDVWDKRNPDAEVFQFGLRSQELEEADWYALLADPWWVRRKVGELLEKGHLLQRYQQKSDAGLMPRSFIVEFEGLKLLALNSPRCNSLTFAAKDVPETGHDALCGFCFNGRVWVVSLYHARHRTDLDLSAIAVKRGGGGHRGACGFQSDAFPFAT